MFSNSYTYAIHQTNVFSQLYTYAMHAHVRLVLVTQYMLLILAVLEGVWWLLEMLAILFQSTLVKGNILA